MSEQTPTAHECFLQQIIANQGMLRAMIVPLVVEDDLVDEILQETNLAMIRNEPGFTPGTDFRAWSASMAFYQVLANSKRRQRSKLVFKDELVQVLAAENHAQAERHDTRLDALRHCLLLLEEPQRLLLEKRYSGRSVRNIARERNKSVGVISQTLYRLRQTLKDCIERRQAGATT